MPRLLIFLSGALFMGTIVLALWTGCEAMTSAHLERCLLRVEDALALAKSSGWQSYLRELGWLATLALSILFFQIGSHIDERRGH